MFGLGITEGLIILGLFLLLFGAKKLPGLGKALGESITNFKKGLNEADSSDTKQVSSDNDKSETDSSTKE